MSNEDMKKLTSGSKTLATVNGYPYLGEMESKDTLSVIKVSRNIAIVAINKEKTAGLFTMPFSECYRFIAESFLLTDDEATYSPAYERTAVYPLCGSVVVKGETWDIKEAAGFYNGETATVLLTLYYLGNGDPDAVPLQEMDILLSADTVRFLYTKVKAALHPAVNPFVMTSSAIN